MPALTEPRGPEHVEGAGLEVVRLPVLPARAVRGLVVDRDRLAAVLFRHRNP